MAFINVNSIARLTRDPELRVTPKGTAICQFGVAINSKFKDGTGADREEVTFVDVEAWAKQGEAIAKHFTKGKPIYFEGRLKQDTWDDKTTGQKRSKLKVVLTRFEFLGSKDDAPASDDAHTPPPRAATPPLIDEEIPF